MDIGGGGHIKRLPPLREHTHINMVITGYNNMLIGIVSSVLYYKQNCIRFLPVSSFSCATMTLPMRSPLRITMKINNTSMMLDLPLSGRRCSQLQV